MYTLRIYLLFIIFNVLTATDDMSNSSRIPSFASLCPYTDFCTSKATKKLTDTKYDSCCQICSCASDCHLVGTCCPDAQPQKSIMPRYECKDLNVILNVARQVSVAVRSSNMYRIIDDCPARNTSNNFSACDTPTKLQDYIVVSDADNEKVFSNQDCAICHGVKDFVEWPLVAKCPEMITQFFKSFEERDEFVVKKCYLNAIPPNKQIAVMSRCFSKDRFFVKDCDPLETNDPYTENLKKACLQQRPNMNTVFRTPGRRGLGRFSNVYCYLCSNPGFDTEVDLCENYDENLLRWSFKTEFSGILAMKEDVSKHTKRDCSPWEIWDSVAHVCRSLRCPLGAIPVNGKCKRAVLSTNGVQLVALFKAEFQRGNTTIELYDILKIIESRFRQFLGKDFTCGMCNTKLFHPFNSSVRFFEVPMYTTENCSTDDLIGKLRSIVLRQLQRSIHFIFQDQIVTVDLIYSRKNMTVEKILAQTVTNPVFCDLNLIQIVDLQTCSRFEMTIEEFGNITKDKSSLRTSYDTALIVDEDKGIVSVCTEYYFNRFASGEAARVLLWHYDCSNTGRAFLFYMLLFILCHM